jgi:hypothetical protein
VPKKAQKITSKIFFCAFFFKMPVRRYERGRKYEVDAGQAGDEAKPDAKHPASYGFP